MERSRIGDVLGWDSWAEMQDASAFYLSEKLILLIEVFPSCFSSRIARLSLPTPSPPRLPAQPEVRQPPWARRRALHSARPQPGALLLLWTAPAFLKPRYHIIYDSRSQLPRLNHSTYPNPGRTPARTSKPGYTGVHGEPPTRRSTQQDTRDKCSCCESSSGIFRRS